MKLAPNQEEEVKETIQAYARAYQNKDIAAFSTLFSPDITGFGSGPDEIIRDHQDLIRQITRDISQATVLSVVFSEQKIFGEGTVAWASSETTMTFTIDGTTRQTLEGRSTMVLRKTPERWIIEQLHFSLPYGEQNPGQSFPGA